MEVGPAWSHVINCDFNLVRVVAMVSSANNIVFMRVPEAYVIMYHNFNLCLLSDLARKTICLLNFIYRLHAFSLNDRHNVIRKRG